MPLPDSSVRYARRARRERPTHDRKMMHYRICREFVILCLAIGTGCASNGRSSQSPASGGPSATTQPAALDLIVLGSGGPDAVGRASTCFVLSVDGSPRILIDAGSGAFVRLGEAGLSLDHLDL